MPFSVLSALSVLLAATLAQADAATEWRAAGTTHGITVAFRDDAQQDVREVRATTDLPFAADRIAALVCDFRQYGSLVDGVDEARLLSGTVPADYEIYLRYAPRFVVVAARDVVVRVRSVSPADGVRGCGWEAVPDREPTRKGVVRMRTLHGSWRIQPLDANRSRVVYQVAADPGGRIPGWLVRRGAVRAIPDVIVEVRRALDGR